jgi:hypothetical protein
MANTIIPLEKGQIRHPNRLPERLMKVVGPFDSEDVHKDGTVQKMDMFVLTHDFPKYHYIVVADIVESADVVGNQQCIENGN